MNDTTVKPNNEQRIRNLELTVERLEQQLRLKRSGDTASLNSNNRMVQIPDEGIPARLGKVPGREECSIVWLNKNNELYVTGESIEVLNWAVTAIQPEDPDRLAAVVRRDDGKWWIDGFDCKSSDNPRSILPLDSAETE